MGEAGAGARKCAVFQNKAKCVVSCPPASGRGGEEGQLGYLGDRAEFINTYSHPRAARTPAPASSSTLTQPAASLIIDTQLQHLSRICIEICKSVTHLRTIIPL